MKQIVIDLLDKILKKYKLKKLEIEKLLEIPPAYEMGDYAFPCFSLSKKLKQNPNKIAEDLSKNIKFPKEIEKVQVSGSYLNFFLNKKILAKSTITEVLKQKDNYGKNSSGKGEKILVEFSSPNIAKPFGIGHLRSTIIGNSISKISEFNGYKIIKMNYLGDWGTQFGKIIFGYKKFGNPSKLKSDAIKHLLEIYVKANKEIYKNKTREEFRKLEGGDKEDIKLWKKFKELSLRNFKHIYDLFGIQFDVYSGESFYNKSSDSVLRLLNKKNLLEKSQGALIVNLEKFKIGIALIQKTDGTTIYLARDISAIIERHKKYKFDKIIYETGQEQTLHFKQLFKILELLGFNWAKNCAHVTHGLYLDKDRKKFATRKGKTVFMEDIINEAVSIAEREIKKRSPKISEKDLKQRALKIAVAAIFYGDLKNNLGNNIIFDIKRFVSFEGDTGPYLQYSYARASSILRKAKTKKQIFKINNLDDKEFSLVKKIFEFPEIVSKAYKYLSPSLIANYSSQLAKTFNEFYHDCPVIGSEKQNFRIALIKSFRQTLKNSLHLLGIDVLEKM